MKMNKIYAAVLFCLLASLIEAQPTSKIFNLIGFQENDTVQVAGFGNAAIFWEKDTVRIDSISYRLPTSGVGCGILNDDTISYVTNGVYGYYPFPRYYKLGLPFPQSSIIYSYGFQSSGAVTFPYGVYGHGLGSNVLHNIYANGQNSVTINYFDNLTQSEMLFGLTQPPNSVIPDFFHPTRFASAPSAYHPQRLTIAGGIVERNGFFVGVRFIWSGSSLAAATKEYFPSDTTKNCKNKGASLFNVQATQYALWGDCKVSLLDFDRCKAELSNYREIIPPKGLMAPGGGLAFSPSGRYLYISEHKSIYRVDINDPILKMELIVDSYPIQPPNVIKATGASYSYMYLAPDNKIYIVPPHRAKYMHVITNPDAVTVTQIGFKQEGLKLPVYNRHTIPMYFNDQLGLLPGGGGLCDSISATVQIPLDQGNVIIYPNPVDQVFYWQYLQPAGTPTAPLYQIQVYNQLGNLVFSQKIDTGTEKGWIDGSQWSAGVYVMTLIDDTGGSIFKKIVKL
jgi:Secretion system C-terminal sorting domain